MVLMHKENFSQVEVANDMLSETEHKFVEEGLALRVQTYEGQPLIVRLPKHMTVRSAWRAPIHSNQKPDRHRS